MSINQFNIDNCRGASWDAQVQLVNGELIPKPVESRGLSGKSGNGALAKKLGPLKNTGKTLFKVLCLACSSTLSSN